MPLGPTVMLMLPEQGRGVHGWVTFTEGSAGPMMAFAPLITLYSQPEMVLGAKLAGSAQALT